MPRFKMVVALLIIFIICTGARWNTYCRHRAVFAAYTVSDPHQNSPQKVRLAVGIIYDKHWHPLESHTRAQAYSEDFDEWHWLCVNKNLEVYTCIKPEVNFVVKHYVTLEEALKGEWGTELFREELME